jgi:DNA-binding NarL/FixJ family response regulator
MKKRVLVVEDEAIIAKDLERILRTYGYDVVGLASSGEESIRQAEVSRPDVVLMDIRLKGEMTGIEAANQICDTLHIPVIYLTADSDNRTSGATGPRKGRPSILKPFGEFEIDAVIRNVSVVQH